MIGQLQDVGNTTTLAHYLALLGGAWMLSGLDKFAGGQARSRAASPKLQALNTALITAPSGMEITYWRDRNQEVDFILRQGDGLLPIEVKSGRNKGALSGLRSFTANFKTGGSLLVGTGGVALEQFLAMGADGWMG